MRDGVKQNTAKSQKSKGLEGENGKKDSRSER